MLHVKGLFDIPLKRSMLQTIVCFCQADETIASLAIVTKYVE